MNYLFDSVVASPTRLDFSRQLVVRRANAPFPLANALWVRLLEQLLRRPVISAARFLLLPRAKQTTAKGDSRPPSHSLRHERSHLRRRIAEFDLPVSLDTGGTSVETARAKTGTQLQSNIHEARLLAKRAYNCFLETDYASATNLAGEALGLDFDCSLASWLIVQVVLHQHQIAPSHDAPIKVGSVAAFKAEVCIARGLLRFSAAIQRFGARRASSDRDTCRARNMARAMIKRLEKQWHVLGNGQLHCPSSNWHAAWREVIEFIVDARCRTPRPLADFITNLIMQTTVTQLLRRRSQKLAGPQWKELTDTLSLEILGKLALNAWEPTQTSSLDEVNEQLVKFLDRRIDWKRVLNHSDGGGCAFDDANSIVEDFEGGFPRHERTRLRGKPQSRKLASQR